MGSRRRDRGGARSLHVRGYDINNTDDRDLRAVFEKFGNVVDVYLPKDYFTKQYRGFAYVQFSEEADADEARKKLDHTEMFNDGREVHIMWAAGERKTPVDMRRLDIERDNPHARRERERGGGPPWPRDRSPRRFGGRDDWDRDRYPRKRFRSPSPPSRYRRDRSPIRRRRHSRSPPRRAPRSRSPPMRRSPRRSDSRSPGPRRMRRSRSPPRRRSRSPGMRGPRRSSRSPGARGPRRSSRSPLPHRSRSPMHQSYERGSPRRPSSRSPPPPRRASSKTPPPPRRGSRSPPPYKRSAHSRSPLRNKEGPIANGNGSAVSRVTNSSGGNGPTHGNNAPPKLRSAPLSPIETTNASNSVH